MTLALERFVCPRAAAGLSRILQRKQGHRRLVTWGIHVAMPISEVQRHSVLPCELAEKEGRARGSQ